MARFQASLIPAMVTPFTPDGSKIDFLAAEKLIKYLLTSGCDGLLINGTTGESPTLSNSEKQEFIAFAQQQLQKNNYNAQLMACIGGNSTNDAVKKTQDAVKKLNLETLLVVVPYYNKPSQQGMLEHFKAVASGVPETEVMIYNIPSRCGVEMQPETMVRIKEACPNVIGVKQSVASMETLSHITRLMSGTDWQIWSGDDPITLPMMACGAKGVVSVLAHVTPVAVRKMIDAFNAGDTLTAKTIHLELLPLAQGLFALPNPTITKALLAEMQLIDSASLRLPLAAPSEEEKQAALKWLPAIEAINQKYNNL